MPPRRRSDPGQGSGTPRYPGTFLLALREAVAGLGWEIRSWRGRQIDCVDAEGNAQTVGLENLYRRARQVERPTWPELISRFLTTVAAAGAGQTALDSLEDVADQLLVRLGPPLNRMPEEAAVWSRPLDETGLCVNLVIDYPDRMCYVTEQLVAESGRPGSRWLEAALTNLQARTPTDGFHVVDEDGGLRICSVADAYDSSRALILDRLLPEAGEGGDGCFVALPGRDTLFVLPVNLKALAQVHLLKMLAEKNFQTAPYPISNEVFWVHGESWHVFPIHVRGEEITVEPPDAFLDILKRLAPDEANADETSESDPEETPEL